ncbi:4826_t:CDS:2, partial [Scutellospora calospora]
SEEENNSDTNFYIQQANYLNLTSGIIEAEMNNNFSWDPDTEINKGKESVSINNTETNLTSSERIETKTKATKKESLELINKPTSQPKDSNDSDLSEKELTTQALIEENTKKLSAPEEKAESINILVIQYQKMTSRRRQKLAFYTQHIENRNTYFVYTHPTLGSHFSMRELREVDYRDVLARTKSGELI